MDLVMKSKIIFWKWQQASHLKQYSASALMGAHEMSATRDYLKQEYRTKLADFSSDQNYKLDPILSILWPTWKYTFWCSRISNV